MATHELAGSWNGTVGNGAYWGLTRKIGPWSPTPADEKRMNSQAGGPHAGHGNWFQSFNMPHFVTDKPPSKWPKYKHDSVVLFDIDFEPPRGMKIPSINKTRGPKRIVGARNVEDRVGGMGVNRGESGEFGSMGGDREVIRGDRDMMDTTGDYEFPPRRMDRPPELNMDSNIDFHPPLPSSSSSTPASSTSTDSSGVGVDAHPHGYGLSYTPHPVVGKR